MSTALATASEPILTLPQRFDVIRAELEGRVFERTKEISTAICALVAHCHHFSVGIPGIGKTYFVDLLTKLIDFGDHPDPLYRTLMTRFTNPDEVLGLPKFSAMKQDRYERNTFRKLPNAYFAVLDEIFKANSAILNALLTILNEGIFFNGEETIDVDLILFGMSNELPQGSELAALWDRLTFRHQTPRLQNNSSVMSMFQARLRQRAAAVPVEAVITWDEVRQARAEAAQVTVPDHVLEKLLELRSALFKAGIEPSERRFNDSLPIIQASAWLAGRDTADVEDMVLLRHVYWSNPKEIPEVDKLVLELANPIDREALNILEGIEKLAKEVDEMVTSTDNRRSRRQLGVTLNGKLERAGDELERLLSANGTGRRSQVIEEARQRLDRVCEVLLKELFNTDDETARSLK